MLVRDIDLVDAVADLFDNCVDGALRLRDGSKKGYEDLWVRMEADNKHFRIADNCGGIPVDIARNYAFRFGRPSDMPLTKHSVGQFGIGMKRALFKLGNVFEVESRTATSSFTLKVNVAHWQQRPEWEFTFDRLQEQITVPEHKRGTTIEVTELNEGVASAFELENFRTRLRERLEGKHQFSLGKGLEVSLNTAPLRFEEAILLSTRELKPAHFKQKYFRESDTPVTVNIYVGIADSLPSAGGWYVYCNGRAVLEADQTDVTGWGEGGAVTIPKYHNQYARFRGYCFFDCDDAGLLPWNTTKTGVSLDSPLYKAVRQEMIALMRPVVTFLNKLKEEEATAKQTGDSPVADQLEKAKEVPLTQFKAATTFQSPSFRVVRTPVGQLISYRKPSDQVAKVRKVLQVTTLKAVGEKTFEYFLKTECKD